VAKAIRTLKEYDGVVEQASETELADAAARADKTGMFNCPHTGVALAALEKLIAAGTIKKSERAVVISTASGLKFTDFKVGYHESKLADVPVCKYANTPIHVPNNYTQVRDQIRRLLGA
jgi:threonine synthase